MRERGRERLEKPEAIKSLGEKIDLSDVETIQMPCPTKTVSRTNVGMLIY